MSSVAAQQHTAPDQRGRNELCFCHFSLKRPAFSCWQISGVSRETLAASFKVSTEGEADTAPMGDAPTSAEMASGAAPARSGDTDGGTPSAGPAAWCFLPSKALAALETRLEGEAMDAIGVTSQSPACSSRAARKSSTKIASRPSCARHLNKFSTCCAQRSEERRSLLTPKWSSPAARSALCRQPLPCESKSRKASAGQSCCAARAQRRRNSRAFVAQSSYSSCCRKTLATGILCHGLWLRRRHPRVSSHHGRRSSIRVS
mmetsp:Transcript_98108/g.233495  ORF Transcript_98108/g.233495 Transcript_98108/m.233495 type:complete len:260 (+) Transcript_98108:603-1382(+)